MTGPRPLPPDPGPGHLAETVERLRAQLDAARAAARARGVVELAKGILVERLKCGPAEAARHLAQLADSARTPVAELAADIVDEAAGDALSRADDGEGAADDGVLPPLRLRIAESGVSDAPDTQVAAESLLDNALRPLGATALAVWSAAGDGSLALRGHAGFTAAEAAGWRHVPPGVGSLAQRALTGSTPMLVADSPAETGPAETGPAETGPAGDGPAGDGLMSDPADAAAASIGRGEAPGGRVVLPARVAGRLLGAVEVCWPGPLPPLTPAVGRQLQALADLCAHTLRAPLSAEGGDPAQFAEHDRRAPLVDLADALLDPAVLLQPLVDDHGRVRDFAVVHLNQHVTDLAGRPRADLTGRSLLEAHPGAAAEGGLFEQALHVHATGEPFSTEDIVLADTPGPAPLRAAVGIGRYGECLLVTWRVQDEAARLSSLLQHAQRLGRIGGFEENPVTGEVSWSSQLFALHGLSSTAAPVPLRELRSRAHPDDGVAIGRFLRTLLHHHRASSVAFRLQRPDTVVRHMRVLAEPVLDEAGCLVAVRGAYQDISSQHWTEVALAATRDRLADSEEHAADRKRLTLQLQEAIMPPAPAQVDASGLQIAVRYRPAENDSLVGGDWYDAVVLPSKQVLLAVGDVAGHGIEAATGMVALRNALRGLATTGSGPGQLLGWLNTVTHHLTEQVTATAVVGVYDPQTRTLRWARAGHLPPVLIRDGAAEALPLPKGILLGAQSEADYEERVLEMRSGDTLLMYTDGLIERRDRFLQQSLDQLVRAASESRPGLEERLDHLLTHSSSDTDDDTCLVGVHLR
ncbi:SpoIIE family protein phosphatase [Wenjunlia tyrosinilytica]|uniref:Transcription antitermination regulator n=1 Tax=Wenjunlia tyrosinilytica TaxID=1544741 RepID=A0A918DXX8_9ACTN|nr:SpoIIE family protein phosphatase [Wenjunlia tyrosinilytica]GGO87918.1 transcription antitermination regulator [Wenjunlia tyrosinilytica]